MESEIRDVIEKNLPSAVGDVLKKRLAQAEQDAKDVATLRDMVKKLTADKEELSARLIADNEREARINQLKKIIDDLREKTTDSRIVELKEKFADEKVHLVTSLFNTVFANAKLKSTIIENSQVPSTCSSPGGGTYTVTNPMTSTKSTETEVG